MSFIQLKNQLESQIRSLENSINIVSVEKQATELIQQQLINNSSVVGVELGRDTGGFRALTTSADDVVAGLPESQVTQLVGSLNIAQLTDQIPTIANTLIPAVSESEGLSKITGSEVSSALLDVVITLPTPEAVAASVNTVASPSKTVIEDLAAGVVNLNETLSVSPADLEHSTAIDLQANKQLLNRAIGQITGAAENIQKAKQALSNSIITGAQNAVSRFRYGFSSLTENIVEDLLSPAKVAFQKVAIKNGIRIEVPDRVIEEVIQLAQSGKINTATKILQGYSDRPGNEVRDVILGLVGGNRLSSVTKQLTDTIPVTTTDLNTVANKWNGVNTKSDAFTIVRTKEELEADLLGAERELTEIIVHHTFSGLNQNLSASDIHDYSVDIYQEGIPYHYIITREGDIQRGRPISLEGSTLVNNHEKFSIQVAFVGGVNAPVGSRNLPDVEKWLSKKSFTPYQWKAFDTLLRVAYNALPGLQVMGHSTIDPAQLDPGFDVPEYVYSKYGKTLLFYQPQNQPPLSRAEIINRIGPQ